LCADRELDGPLPAASAHAVVPSGAVDSVLCVYQQKENSTSATIPLAQSRKAVATAKSVVAMVNGLPANSTSHRVCGQMVAPFYEVVFSYAGGKAATIQVSPNCLTVARDGYVRDVDDLGKFLKNWATT
jgi:hypothetical protein